MKLIDKIQLGFFIPAGFLVIVGGWSIWGFWQINHQVGTIYDDRVVPLKQLKLISDKYAVDIIDQVNKANEDIIGLPQALSHIQAAQSTIEQQWNAYLQTDLTPEERELAEEVETYFTATNQEIEQLIAVLEANDREGLAQFDGPLYLVMDPLTSKVQELIDLQLEIAKQERAKAKGIFTQMSIVLFSLIGITIIIVVLPLRMFISRLIINTLKQTVNTLASTSTEIATASAQQESLAAQQADYATKVATTMSELKASSVASSQQAESVALGARKVLSLSEDGKGAIQETLAGMNDLQEGVNSITRAIAQLQQQISEIDNYQNIVSEMFAQTSMLALNASVEAVRAGEKGQGFAVVANEIRKLADQTKDSTTKINDLIDKIQAALKTTVYASNSGVETLQTELAIAEKMSKTFASVSEAIDQVTGSIQEISLNSKQQAVAVEQVVEEISFLSQAAIETASGASQTKIGTQTLKAKADELKALF